MNRIFNILLYSFVIIVFIFTIIFFISHLPDSDFVDNAMSNLFATSLGVLIGIPIGLEINRKQAKIQEKRNFELILIKEKGLLRSYLFRVKSELNVNVEMAKNLDRTIDFAFNKNNPISWNWAIEIVNSFLFTAFQDYDRSGLERISEKESAASIHEAYFHLKNLEHTVRLNAAEFNYIRTNPYSTYNPDYKHQQINESRNNAVHLMEKALSVISKDPLLIEIN